MLGQFEGDRSNWLSYQLTLPLKFMPSYMLDFFHPDHNHVEVMALPLTTSYEYAERGHESLSLAAAYTHCGKIHAGWRTCMAKFMLSCVVKIMLNS